MSESIATIAAPVAETAIETVMEASAKSGILNTISNGAKNASLLLVAPILASPVLTGVAIGVAGTAGAYTAYRLGRRHAPRAYNAARDWIAARRQRTTTIDQPAELQPAV